MYSQATPAEDTAKHEFRNPQTILLFCLFLKWLPQTFGEGIVAVFVCRQGVEVTRMPRSHFSPLSTLLSSLTQKWFPVCINNTMWSGMSHGLQVKLITHVHCFTWNAFLSSNRAGVPARGTQECPVPTAHLQHSMHGPRSAPFPSTLAKITSGRNGIFPFRYARIFRRRALGCLLQR